MDYSKRSVMRPIDKTFIVLFFISFLNSTFGLLFYFLVLYYWKYGIVGGIKALLFITARGIMSPAVAAIPTGGFVKLGLIMLTSLWILANARFELRDKKKASGLILYIVTFGFIVLINCLISCSYPTTAFFKYLSFAIPFLATILGIGATRSRYNWADFIACFLTILFAVSFVLIPFPRFRITNSAFQGIFNHVNMFGIVAALYVAFVLESEYFKSRNKLRLIILIGTFLMIFLSASRTGMISALLILILYFWGNKENKSRRTIFIFSCFTILGIVFICVPSVYDWFQTTINEFLWKNGSTYILESRSNQIEEAIVKYNNNPILGSGFMVPYTAGLCDMGLRFDIMVEPGNILSSLLGDVGIVGLSVFALMILYVSISGKKSKLFLLVGSLMVNMGEMVFFSSNNMSIIIYALIGSYLFNEEYNCINYREINK